MKDEQIKRLYVISSHAQVSVHSIVVNEREIVFCNWKSQSNFSQSMVISISSKSTVVESKVVTTISMEEIVGYIPPQDMIVEEV